MKKITVCMSIALVALLLGMGCERGSTDKQTLTFDNASRWRVTVIPLTTEWERFALEPGEVRRVGKVRDADFRFGPTGKVQLGGASSDRYVIFVDAPPP